MLTTRRTFVAQTFAALAAVALASSAILPALAAGNEPKEYTQDAFDAAQKAGKPILIETYADWCDICKRQKPIIDKLVGEPKFKDLVTLRVNFDTQKDIMRKFNARQQSTLVVFHGAKEVGRTIGETQSEWIEDLMEKALENSTSS